MSGIAPESATEELRQPRGWLAGLMSLLVSGLGHLYAGRWLSAVLLMLVAQSQFPLLALLIATDGLSFWNFMLCMVGGVAIQLCGAIHAVVMARRTAPFVPPWWNRWYGLIGAVVLYLIVVMAGALLYEDPIKSFSIPANSMQPNLPEGDRVVGVGLFGKPVERGEIVIFRSAAVNYADYVKRVVALAGDTVELRNNQLLVNDQAVTQQAVGSVQRGGLTYDLATETIGRRSYRVLLKRDQSPRLAGFARMVVPRGHIFVLGDNRDNSYDSRFFGPVRIEDIHWRAALVFWSRDHDRIGIDLRESLQ